jgi:hypothetical protein
MSRSASRSAFRAARRMRIAGAAALLLAACGDPTRPDPRPIAIVAGIGATTDTVMARRAAVVVEVRDDAGRPLPGAGVRAMSGHLLLDPESAATAPMVFLTTPGAPSFEAEIALVTGADGRATFEMVLGPRAGEASLVVRLVDGGAADTARFVLRAGARAAVHMEPRDTTVTSGTTFDMRAVLTDSHGNPHPDHVPLLLPEGTLALAPGGRVLALQPGRVRVSARYGTLSDTALVSIVPAGTLVAVQPRFEVAEPYRLLTLRTDGTARDEIASVPAESLWANYFAPAWTPGADLVVVPYAPSGDLRLHAWTLDGTRRRLITGAVRPTSGEVEPRWSRDASWIYFTGFTDVPSSEIWRVRPNGADAMRLTTASASRRYGGDSRPSPSPDERLLAFVSDSMHPLVATLVVLDLATGSWRDLGVRPFGAPAWSPDGAWILYQDDALHLRLVRPDGTGERPLLATGNVVAHQSGGYAWSPDGRWVVARLASRLVLIEVATGLAIPVPGSEQLFFPDWGR